MLLTPMHATVSDYLDRSPSACATARLSLGRGRSVTIWENQNDRISYETPAGHTFSHYLQGGEGTRRVDGGAMAGWPGAVCVMPAGTSSSWEITAPFRFVHLHIPDSTLAASFAHIHDSDARNLHLQEATFSHAPTMATSLAQMAHAAAQGDLLRADTAIAELVAHLPSNTPRLKGGLSPYQLRRVDDWIEAHMATPIRLVDLAMETGLSEFHFHRMFRLCRGISPHQWVTSRRIGTAKNKLAGTETIADIAQACGFACQSHLTRAFKNETGLTPRRYRSCLSG